MPECVINGVPVNFPFEPYDVQKTYMSKVIECLQNRTNGMLESPTGTGKTLSLLCSTLGWLLTKKAETQAQSTKQIDIMKDLQTKYGYDPLKKEQSSNASDILNDIAAGGGISMRWNVPKVIYASRTHSQLSQAMQELKRSSYGFMKAIVLGSRDQLCIHPEVSKETNNSAKMQMCKLRLLTRSCSYHLNVEKNKNHPHLTEQSVMDIEDLVTVGRKLKTCPYYASRELIQSADIIFMPYNYLLDPKARKANKIELNNTIVILDEAHNVEKMCEESASVQLKSSDIALAIDELTQIMKSLESGQLDLEDESDSKKDFSIDDLLPLKQIFLDLEKAVDDIEVTLLTGGTTFAGGFIFELLAKADIHHGSQATVNRLLDSLIQFSAAENQNNSMFRKGAGFEVLSDLLTIVFAGKDEGADEKIRKCFKVHVELEEVKETKKGKEKDGWITPKSVTTKKKPKVINYWCFNPGYGMEQLLSYNVHSVILTSGTLSPLKPLIAELAIPISVHLENPHIVGKSQVCVKIVPFGPDKEPLVSNYQNRDNPKYLSSLGRTILAFCPIIPDGLLVFFPSYMLMNKCVDSWQASGIWSQINRHKTIFVEPRFKDAFTTTMTEFYEKINDPASKGAIFMAVCRGKVSEGLDFADRNGRAVIITGLPFPPLKDPRVILKKKYLEENRTRENELLSGDGWYGLEAIRAVNQAIGRVIRHKDDYGAILLCDSRFNVSSQRSQLSTWIQGHLQNAKTPNNFGQFIGDISRFFRNAQTSLPQPVKREVCSNDDAPEDKKFQTELADIGAVRKRLNIPDRPAAREMKVENANEVSGWHPNEYKDVYNTVIKNRTSNPLDFGSRLESSVSSIDFNNMSRQSNSSSSSLVTIHKREKLSPTISENGSQATKRRKLKIVSNASISSSINSPPEESTSSTPPLFSSLTSSSSSSPPENTVASDQSIPADRTELLKLIKSSVSSTLYSEFVKALMTYQKDDNIMNLTKVLKRVFQHPCLEYLLHGMKRFVKANHKEKFEQYLKDDNVV